jgi:hypothetical protein
MGYEIDEAEVAYWGRCPDCQAQAQAATHSDPPTRRPLDSARGKPLDGARGKPLDGARGKRKNPASAEATAGRNQAAMSSGTPQRRSLMPRE